MSPVLLPLFLIVTLAVASGAHAQSTISGGFLLEAVPLDGNAYPERRNCLMSRLNRSRPALVNFDGEGVCGLASSGPIVALIWDITPVPSGDSGTTYRIRNRGNGKCLVRGERYPVLDRCDSPHATWSFDEIEVGTQGSHITALRSDASTFAAFKDGATGAPYLTDEPDVATMFRLTPVSSRRPIDAKRTASN